MKTLKLNSVIFTACLCWLALFYLCGLSKAAEKSIAEAADKDAGQESSQKTSESDDIEFPSQKKKRWRIGPLNLKTVTDKRKKKDDDENDDLAKSRSSMPESSGANPKEAKGKSGSPVLLPPAGKLTEPDNSSNKDKENSSALPSLQDSAKGQTKPALPSNSASAATQSHLAEIDAKAAPPSAKIVVLPFLLSGHPCTLSVIGADGKPISNGGVYLDEELLSCNNKGQSTFTVPEGESFELSLLGEGQRKINKHKFTRAADKVYSENDKLADMAAALLKVESTAGGAPLITYTPAVLSPDELFVIAGHNLSEKIADDYVDIDGSSARIYSASPEGVLAQAPAKLSIGPLRELFMTVGGQASNAAEIDIATPFFTHVKTEADDVSPEKGKIGMNGTNIPCLLKVSNLNQENVSLWSPMQEPLGKDNIMLSPGGDQNYLNIDVRLLNSEKEPKVDLELEQEIGANIDLVGQAPPQLLTALCRAEIMRLERRRISASYRLDELNKKESSESSATNTKSAEEEKLSSERKALSMRLRHVSIMLAARKAIYESLGCTDAQFRQALDDAAGGALFTLDQSIKPIQIISDGGVAGLQFADSRTGRISKRGRLLRMLEPPMHLLPPMNDSQIAIMNARRATYVESTEPSTDSSGLRPSLPEPEPEVSASNRAPLPAKTEDEKNQAAKPASKQTTDKANSDVGTKKQTESKSSVSSDKKKVEEKKKSNKDEKATDKHSKGSKSKRRGKHEQEETPAPRSHQHRHGKKAPPEKPKKGSSSAHRRHKKHAS